MKINTKKVCIGIISKPVGIKGQVRIRPYTSTLDVFLSFRRIFLLDNTPIILKNPKADEKGNILAYIQDIINRNQADLLRLKRIYINREDLPDLKDNDDEYYFVDLIGLDVLNKDNIKLGKVNEALDYGAGTFLDILLNDTKKIATIPFNKNSIINIDIDNNREVIIDEAFLLK